LANGTRPTAVGVKRAFGLDRCTWKGDTGFVAYVRLGVLTANLLLLARHQLA
jgi:hypothetical protein